MSAAAPSGDRAPPEGFHPHQHRSPLTDPWEPLYIARGETGLDLGLYLRPEHTNRRGMAHGGLIAALADNTMGMACHVAAKARGFEPGSLVTASLQVDYFGRAELGQWMVFAPTFIKLGKTLSFASLQVTADGKPVAKASAVFATS
ncbi:PaaI family thioesterase [soil metagenome]